MLVCNKFCSAQPHFLNNSSTVFTDFQFREETAVTISDPKKGVKSNVRTQADFGPAFLAHWEAIMGAGSGLKSIKNGVRTAT